MFILRLSSAIFLPLLFLPLANAGYGNFNSVLIGQQAAGMGGAYTALSEDSAAVPFYNPAAMTRMQGSSFSASVSAYQKLETEFSQTTEFLDNPRRINDGYFEPVPSSAGSIIALGHFALGLSVVIPDFNTFSGEIEASTDITSFLSSTDESLWVGGSFALNLSKKTSVGFTTYYTARQYIRSISDQLNSGSDAQVTIEEKSFTNNSILYLLGIYHQLTDNWSLGSSLRFPSIEVAGRGSYFLSEINTNPSSVEQTSDTQLLSNTKIPGRWNLGVAYKKPQKFTLSFDISYFMPVSYNDFDISTSATDASDLIEHLATWNFALGGEYFYFPWLCFRAGVFTNFSSHPEIVDTSKGRGGDHIDMFGISSNITIHTSKNTILTFGGYWTGGEGQTIQLVGQELKVIERKFNNFTMLIGSAYHF